MATKSLLPNRLQSGEYYRTRYTAMVEATTNIEDLLEPAYWLHVESKLRPMDTIDVLSEDGSWFVELMVTARGKGWAKVQKLREVKFDEEASEPAADAKVFVQWKGPHTKFAVIRKEDSVILKDKFAAKKDAQNWADSHEQMAA